ncbi:hypothetical protein VSR82_28040 [Burkholderia sp. JPY481]|uniref:hypothetical protein n=1 Tax=unclassified Paraburkholderia TaxID=2615204 RepID=UPI00317C7826
MKRGQVVGLICGAVLAGCVSAGVDVSPEQMSNFKPGVTTLQEVVAALGPASVESALDDGSTLLVYTYVTSRPHPESFLPFIGSLVGGSDTHSSAAVFMFGPQGILKSASTTTSTVGTGLSSVSSDLQRKAPAASASPPVVVERVQPPAVQSIGSFPEENVQSAPDDGVETSPEDSVQPDSRGQR